MGSLGVKFVLRRPNEEEPGTAVSGLWAVPSLMNHAAWHLRVGDLGFRVQALGLRAFFGVEG